MRSLAALLTLVVAAALIGSIAVVRQIHRPTRRWRDVAGARLLYGIPWGSLVVIAFVLCVYLFVQDGITDFDDPVTIPFRAWSYFYPLGMATAAFSHAGPGHLVGNLAGTVVVAPLAEYAWGHFPDSDTKTATATDTDAATDDRDRTRAADAWRTDPRIRAFVLFPLAVIGIGLTTSLFALGPVIGFSGVVFAFAGFAIVHYPIATIVGTLGVQSVILRLYYALQEPIRVYTAEPSPPSAPSWAGIAIQGHAIGLFLGFVLGIALLERRNARPNPLFLWLAILLFGFSKNLWAIYWFGGENTYVLFQGPGIAVVAVLALVVTLSMTASEKPLLSQRVERLLARMDASTPASDSDSENGTRSAVARPLELASGRRDGDGTATARLDRIREIVGDTAGPRRAARQSNWIASLTRKRTAFMAVLCILAILAGIAIPANFLVVEDATASSDAAVEIEDYTVEYVEGVPNGLVSGIGIDAIESDEGLESSGVIVASEQRNVWLEAVSAQRLSFTGEETVYVGGAGWREAVHVERTGWEPVGNDTVYQVWIEDGGDRRLAHESNESRAEARIAGRNVTIDSDGGEFVLEVQSDGTEPVATTPVPAENETASAGGLSFERENESIYAAADGTRVAVASEERYDEY
ncbi:rhomboid family intramembrane serine protease [Natrinema salifodinae]|uniref:Membrane associated serine protease, rhomboid family n=1 Tax=Natrinema salifodinae TaxID=1202768 RepID=A0A1I0QYQ1_9EURY|nr:rhomboid family intramembrane serine protease [Natrinema salifodinae]SEW32546.1 Membrane associated serine protease, rhomboid family [Natrinema salifodinae]